MPVRLLIVDDHAVVRQLLVRLLNADPDFDVVGEAADGFAAVRLAQDLKPDLILMDLYLPGLGGIEAMRQIKQSATPCEVVVFTASDRHSDVLDAVRAGSRGYILKTSDISTFLAQVRDAASGLTPMSPAVTSKLIDSLSSERPASHFAAPGPDMVLTRREQEVLELLSRGLTNRQIAGALGISPNTASVHMRCLMQKLGAHNRTTLALRHLRKGSDSSSPRAAPPTGHPQPPPGAA